MQVTYIEILTLMKQVGQASMYTTTGPNDFGLNWKHFV